MYVNNESFFIYFLIIYVHMWCTIIKEDIFLYYLAVICEKASFPFLVNLGEQQSIMCCQANNSLSLKSLLKSLPDV